MKKSNPDAPQQTSAPRKVKDRSAGQVGASILRTVGKGIFTVLAIVLVTVIVVGVAFLLFLYSMRNEKISDDLMTSFQQSFSSTIYINGTGPESPEATSIVELQSGPERVWVDYEDIPQAMKDAVVAIEDKRFWQHKGVDWQRTVGAVLNLFSSDGQNYGGSTITQQLIKNLTGDDDVSITRKVKEIFRALNLEKEYSKEEILEAYLNCVSFGSNTIGVQAAANLYFGKDISDCDVAECAAIAGITQNPSRYNPLIHADNNRERQQLVLSEMYDQGLISESDYNQAMEESNHMTFVGKEGGSQNSIWDWYTDAVISDVQDALMEKYNCSASAASTMIYTNGLQIYSAVDQDLQDAAENYVLNEANFGSDDRMETGVAIVGYDGRVLALVGGRSEKTANRINSFATTLPQQTGSSNKPIGVYAPSLEAGIITYSSLVEDEPFAGYYGEGSDRLGPLNYSLDNLGRHVSRHGAGAESLGRFLQRRGGADAAQARRRKQLPIFDTKAGLLVPVRRFGLCVGAVGTGRFDEWRNGREHGGGLRDFWKRRPVLYAVYVLQSAGPRRQRDPRQHPHKRRHRRFPRSMPRL